MPLEFTAKGKIVAQISAFVLKDTLNGFNSIFIVRALGHMVVAFILYTNCSLASYQLHYCKFATSAIGIFKR
jgi:hypothetical protein